MSLEVRYSIRARKEEIDLLEYIIEKFGQEKAKEVFFRIEKVLEEISIMPEMFQVSTKKEGLRRCVFSK
ncbi:MAG: type II toxin-antitoxin system RelE/ParE family toxin [Cyclobacteriaceae bacterium]|nr:type II toxin-antitoxin system RelE/ParE family toxin [Cyclobacteriaceae bacterium SS2]